MLLDASHEFLQNGPLQFPGGEAAKECVKGAGGRSGFNLHRPAPRTLPLTALTDDNFIISDGKSRRLL